MMLFFRKSWLVSAAFALMSGLSMHEANQLPHPSQAKSNVTAGYASPVISLNDNNDPLFIERDHPFVALVDASLKETNPNTSPETTSKASISQNTSHGSAKPHRFTHSTIHGHVSTHVVWNTRVWHAMRYSNSDLYWLSRIIEAEAGGEPMSAKLAVGQVVMNRVHSPEFPDSVYDVVFQKTCGVYEFSPVANGSIYNTPSAESIQAAKAVLNGSVNIVPSALVFYNPSLTSKGNWVRHRHVIESIGHLTFAE